MGRIPVKGKWQFENPCDWNKRESRNLFEWCESIKKLAGNKRMNDGGTLRYPEVTAVPTFKTLHRPRSSLRIGRAVRADFRRLYPANAKTWTCCPSDDNRTKVTNSVTSARPLWWHVGPYFWPADLTRTANPNGTLAFIWTLELKKWSRKTNSAEKNRIGLSIWHRAKCYLLVQVHYSVLRHMCLGELLPDCDSASYVIWK